MPKELHEIKNFQHGIVSSPSTTDIPEEAATFSRNIDPSSESGVLKGIPEDDTLAVGVNATSVAEINDRITYYDFDNDKFVKIQTPSTLNTSSHDFIYASDWKSDTDLTSESIDGISTHSNATVSIVDEEDSSENRKNVLKWINTASTDYSSIRMFHTNNQWSEGDIVRIRFDYFIPTGSGIDRVRPYVGSARPHRANATQVWDIQGSWATYDVELEVANVANTDLYLRIYWSLDGDADSDLTIPSGNYAYIDNLVIQKNRTVSKFLNSGQTIAFPSFNKRQDDLYVGMGANTPPIHISEENFVQYSELKSSSASAIGDLFDKFLHYSTSGTEHQYFGWKLGFKSLYRITYDTSDNSITKHVTANLDLENVETIGLGNDKSKLWIVQTPDSRIINPCYIYSVDSATAWNASNTDITTTPISTTYSGTSLLGHGAQSIIGDSIRVSDIIETKNDDNASDNSSVLWIVYNATFNIGGALWREDSSDAPYGKFLYAATYIEADSSINTILSFEDKSFPGMYNGRLNSDPISFGWGSAISVLEGEDYTGEIDIENDLQISIDIVLDFTSFDNLSFAPMKNSIIYTGGNHRISLGINFVNTSITSGWGERLLNNSYIYTTSYGKSTNWETVNTENGTSLESLLPIPSIIDEIGSGATTDNYILFRKDKDANTLTRSIIGSIVTANSSYNACSFLHSNATETEIVEFLDISDVCIDSSLSMVFGQNRQAFGSYFKISDITAANPTLSNYDADEMYVKLEGLGSSGTIEGTYEVKFSYLYDGFQESPLNSIGIKPLTVTTGNYDTVRLVLGIKKASIPARVTDVIVYVKDGANYRFLEQKNINSFFIDPDDSERIMQNYYLAISNKEKSLSATYEARTGCPQTIKRNIVNYELSEELNGELFVANCFIPETDEPAKAYIFKSKPGNFSQFNWINDNLLLPEAPVAIKSLNGRLFAFTPNKIFRINPQGLYIEDIHEGVGCLNKHCVVTTEYGMFLVDRNGAYLHDGSNITKLSTPIESFSYATWSVGLINFLKQSIQVSNSNRKLPVKVSYEPNKGSFLIWGHDVLSYTGVNEYVGRVWAYNLERQRWDYWDAPMHQGLLSKRNGDTYIFTKAYKVKNYLKGDSLRKWEWFSKDIDLGLGTQQKIFSRVKLVGNMTQTIGTVSSADSLSVIADRNSYNSSYTELSRKKDYFRLKNVNVLYDKTSCELEGGTFPDSTTICPYLSGSLTTLGSGALFGIGDLTPDNFPHPIEFINTDTTNSVTISTSTDLGSGEETAPTIYMLDENGNYAWFKITTKAGNPQSLEIGALDVANSTGSSIVEGDTYYIDIVDDVENPWHGQINLPKLVNPGGGLISNNFVYTSLPTCTFTEEVEDGDDIVTTQTDKIISAKKMKTMQIQLRNQTESVDSIGIIYRRKSVK